MHNKHKEFRSQREWQATRSPLREQAHLCGRGFTLAELIVTLAIAAILAAVTIPNLLAWYQSYKGTERQANAELIYTTAQNNIAQLKANGQLNDVKDSTAAVTGDRVTLAAATSNVGDKDASAEALGNDTGIIALSSDDTSAKDALDLLVPNISDSLSRVGFSSMSYSTAAHYRIELNPTTGYVYRVYFAEDPISNEEVSGKSDDELAAEGIGVYGNTVPKTFATEEKQPASWVGYFEFAKDGNATSVTGGYFYQMYENYTTSSSAVDRLHNANRVDEGAVDSTDGTAYGVLVSKSKVDSETFTPPTSFTKRYEVQLSNELNMPGQQTDCYFYELGAPASSHDGWATYTVTFVLPAPLNWFFDSPTYTYQAPVGSTVSITNDDLNQVKWDFGIFGAFLGQGRSNPSEQEVRADGSTSLTMYLTWLGGRISKTPSINDDDGQAILPTGVGVWRPWETVTNNATLQAQAFYINQNFAACISKGDQEPTDTSSYQVRTDDQLQHIGSPYGSTYNEPDTSYLDKDFYQTHDITINQLWYPIGQDSAKGQGNSRFTGHFYGSYSGYDTEDHSNLQAPTDDDGTKDFGITLTKREGQSDPTRANALFNTMPAYDTNDTYRSYGIFGYVTGGISHTHVSVGSDDTAFDLAESFDTPHYGTLVGDLTDEGSIDHSSVNVAKNSSMRIQQGNDSEDWRTTDDVILAGLCGYLGGDATISNSSLTLEDNGTNEQEPRLRLAAAPRENIGRSVSVGGLVGRASCNKEKFLSDCSVNLDDDATLQAQGNTSGGKQVSAGGFVGYALAGDQASIEDCGLTVARTLRVETPDSNQAWNNPTSMGGFAGYVEGGTNIVRASLTDGDSTNGNVIVTAKANGTQAAAGGMFGYLHNASFDTAGVNIDSDLTVTATSTNTNGLAGGIVGFADNDDSSALKNATLTVGGNANVSSTDSYTAYAGGIAGRLTRMALESPSVTVNGAGKALTVTARGAHTTSDAGGMVGEMENATGVSSPTLTARTLSVTSTEDDGEAIAGGLVGHAAKGDQEASGITSATIAVNGDTNIESTGTTNYALSGLLAGQLESVAVDGATSSVTGNLTSKATDTNGASARAAGLIAQFENGATLNAATLNVTGNLDATASSNNGSSLASGYIAYAASDPAPLQATGASLSVGGNLNTQSSARETGDGCFSGALAGQLRSVGFGSPTVNVGGSLTSTTENTGGAAQAGGLVGEIVRNGNVDAANLSSVNPTLHDATVTAKSTRGDTYAGGLAGHDDSSDITDSALNPQGNLTVNASDSGSALYAGGYVGAVDFVTASNAGLSPTGSISVDASTKSSAQTVRAGGFAGNANTSTIANASMRPTGRTGVTASGTSEVHAGGFVAKADSSALSDTSFAPGADLSVTGTTSGYSDAFAGGLVGQAVNSSSATRATMTPTSTTSVSATSNSNAYAGGAAGQADSSTLSDSSLAPQGNLTVTGTSNGSSSASVGGFVGHARSLTARNDALRPAANVSVNGTGKSDTHAGGLMGHTEDSSLSYLSLLENAGTDGVSVSISGDTSSGWGAPNVAGGFGNASNTSIDNSYVVTRNAPLALSSKGNNDATGGFAGKLENGSANTSYLAADIVSDNSISGFVDQFSQTQLWADHVIATMVSSNGGNIGTAAAFARYAIFNNFNNGPAGDYAIVTGANGETPYNFLFDENQGETAMPACSIYKADASDPTSVSDPKRESGKRDHGAHPVSLAWLAGRATYDETYNSGFSNDNPFHYRGFTDFVATKRDASTRYPYVTGSSALRDGDNPFPTATRDAGGAYINYGNWPAVPASVATDSSDTQDADSSSTDTTAAGTQGEASDSTNGGSTAQNGNATASDSANSNGTPANAPAQSSESSSANAAESRPANAEGATGGDNQ